jgi:ABC-2 type transport system ATP-binding protein
LALTDGDAIHCPDEVAKLMVGAGVPPTQLLTDEEDLEHYFLRLIGENGAVQHA